MGTIREYTPLNDVWVMGLVLLCFLALLLCIGHQRKFIGKASRKFFLPTNREEKPGQKTNGERFLPWICSLVLVASSGLMLFTYLCSVYDLEVSRYYIWSILLLCIGGLAGYHLLRWLLYCFVNWIFFERRERTQWMEGFYLMLTFESAVIYVLACVAIFYHLPLDVVVLAVTICYALLRLIVIPCTKRIFFPHFYGFLHFIAYLCTLEVLPLSALWFYCMYWGSNLVAK